MNEYIRTKPGKPMPCCMLVEELLAETGALGSFDGCIEQFYYQDLQESSGCPKHKRLKPGTSALSPGKFPEGDDGETSTTQTDALQVVLSMPPLEPLVMHKAETTPQRFLCYREWYQARLLKSRPLSRIQEVFPFILNRTVRQQSLLFSTDSNWSGKNSNITMVWIPDTSGIQRYDQPTYKERNLQLRPRSPQCLLPRVKQSFGVNSKRNTPNNPERLQLPGLNYKRVTQLVTIDRGRLSTMIRLLTRQGRFKAQCNAIFSLKRQLLNVFQKHCQSDFEEVGCLNWQQPNMRFIYFSSCKILDFEKIIL